MARNVFIVNDDNTLNQMNQSSYSSERELQDLVGHHPNILTNLIEDETGEEERWMLIKQEMRVLDGENSNQRWPVDHLFITNKGVPVLVEVKRSTDPRVRREVVGQMLDYASNAVAYWSIVHIRESLKNRCEEVGLNFEQEFEKFVLDIDQNEFWEKVYANLKIGKIKMIFVADSIPKELRRIIEFLNEQLDPAEVLGVEIIKYEPTSTGKIKTLVSKIIGLSSQAEKRKLTRIIEPDTPREGLQEACDKFNELYSAKFNLITRGTASNYRQIKVDGLPPSLHYEFLYSKNGICVEFHIEADGYEEVANKLKTWVVEKNYVLNEYDLSFDSNWSKKRGRVRAIPKDIKTAEITANTMKLLIDEISKIV